MAREDLRAGHDAGPGAFDEREDAARIAQHEAIAGQGRVDEPPGGFVVRVHHPADEAQCLGLALDPPPKADTLHATGDTRRQALVTALTLPLRLASTVSVARLGVDRARAHVSAFLPKKATIDVRFMIPKLFDRVMAWPHLRNASARRLSGSGHRDGWVAGQSADLGGTRLREGSRGALER